MSKLSIRLRLSDLQTMRCLINSSQWNGLQGMLNLSLQTQSSLDTKLSETNMRPTQWHKKEFYWKTQSMELTSYHRFLSLWKVSRTASSLKILILQPMINWITCFLCWWIRSWSIILAKQNWTSSVASKKFADYSWNNQCLPRSTIQMIGNTQENMSTSLSDTFSNAFSRL